MIFLENAGGTELAASQVTVGTSPTLLVARRSPRGSVTVINLGTVDVWLGGSGVTATTGILLAGVKGQTVTLSTSAAVYAVVGTGTQAVSVAEVF